MHQGGVNDDRNLKPGGGGERVELGDSGRWVIGRSRQKKKQVELDGGRRGCEWRQLLEGANS